MPYFDQYGPNFDETGNNAARDYAQYAQSPDFQRRPPGNPLAALARLFGGQQGSSYQPGQIKTQDLPQLQGPPQGGNPFGGSGAPNDPAGQQPIQPKPATQLASAKSIADRINKMLGNTPEPAPPVDFNSFFPHGLPINGQFQQNSPATPYQQPNASMSGGMSPFDYFHMGMPRERPRQRIVMHADGGEHLPGFMRGGYPELYTAPVRHTFDSGGESYVGQHYGDSGGRADDVNAKLSPREYVVDAETMALLGDGNPDEGAKKMDTLRSNIRKHKGKNLAKGKISPDAKPAASYIARNAMGTGLNTVSTKS